MNVRFYPFTLLLALGLPCAAEVTIMATSKPGREWHERPTTLLSDLSPLSEDVGMDPYGGMPSKLTRATGYFHTQKIGSRWWLVTPDGGLFISRGINTVTPVDTKDGQDALRAKFGSTGEWAKQTMGLLKQNGFNSLGGWADTGTIASGKVRLPQTVIWSFMSSYGRQRGGTRQEPGHTGYPSDCPFIFDPGFQPFCENYAKQLDAFKDDPWIIGHFSDNEMPWSLKLLENYLSLPADDPGHVAAAAWLKSRPGQSGKQPRIDDADRADFLRFAMERYLAITATAFRKHAPHHLFLGPRLHGSVTRIPEAFAALGSQVDVISINYYGAWSPEGALLEMWNRESGKPVLISEFYAKAENSGLPNTGGAGWLVKTQQDRGAFYQNFTLGLIKSRICVGWHWHRYADNDPADKKLDPSNRDSNKGIVSNRYEPFPELLDSMGAVNLRVYGLADRFDSARP